MIFALWLLVYVPKPECLTEFDRKYIQLCTDGSCRWARKGGSYYDLTNSLEKPYFHMNIIGLENPSVPKDDCYDIYVGSIPFTATIAAKETK